MWVCQVVLRMHQILVVLALILAVCEYGCPATALGCSTEISKLRPRLKVGSQYAFSALIFLGETLPPSWPMTAVVPIL